MLNFGLKTDELRRRKDRQSLRPRTGQRRPNLRRHRSHRKRFFCIINLFTSVINFASYYHLSVALSHFHLCLIFANTPCGSMLVERLTLLWASIALVSYLTNRVDLKVCL